MSDLKLDARDERWRDLTGTVCQWCGRTTEPRYLAPVIVVRRDGSQNKRALHCVCVECVAADRVPRDWRVDMPQYDHAGRRIAG